MAADLKSLLPRASAVFRAKFFCLFAVLAAVRLLRPFVSPSTLATELTLVTAIAVVPALWLAVQREEPRRSWITFALLCDLVALTLGIHFGGGADHASGVILYGVIILLGGVLASEQVSNLLNTVAITLYTTMVAAEYLGWVALPTG